MRLLLDTHIFLWYVKADRKLKSKTQALIQNANEVYVSSASIWEAAIKASLGKLDVKIDDLVSKAAEEQAAADEAAAQEQASEKAEGEAANAAEVKEEAKDAEAAKE